MKDIVIKGIDIKRELWVFACCVLVMELVNIYAIISYDGRWLEVIKSLGFVFVAAVILYLLLGIIRFTANGIRKLINKQ